MGRSVFQTASPAAILFAISLPVLTRASSAPPMPGDVRPELVGSWFTPKASMSEVQRGFERPTTLRLKGDGVYVLSSPAAGKLPEAREYGRWTADAQRAYFRATAWQEGKGKPEQLKNDFVLKRAYTLGEGGATLTFAGPIPFRREVAVPAAKPADPAGAGR